MEALYVNMQPQMYLAEREAEEQEALHMNMQYVNMWNSNDFQDKEEMCITGGAPKHAQHLTQHAKGAVRGGIQEVMKHGHNINNPSNLTILRFECDSNEENEEGGKQKEMERDRVAENEGMRREYSGLNVE